MQAAGLKADQVWSDDDHYLWFAKLYPGYLLTEGMSGENVRDLQSYLSVIGRNLADIPEIPVTGYFGPQTREAVTAFQNAFGITPSGAVGAVTWNTIAQQYDFLIGGN